MIQFYSHVSRVLESLASRLSPVSVRLQLEISDEKRGVSNFERRGTIFVGALRANMEDQILRSSCVSALFLTRKVII